MSMIYLRSLSNSFSAIASVRPAMPAPLEEEEVSENTWKKSGFDLHDGNACPLLSRHCRWNVLKGSSKSSEKPVKTPLLLTWSSEFRPKRGSLFLDRTSAQFDTGCQCYYWTYERDRSPDAHVGPYLLNVPFYSGGITAWDKFSRFYSLCLLPETTRTVSYSWCGLMYAIWEDSNKLNVNDQLAKVRILIDRLTLELTTG